MRRRKFIIIFADNVRKGQKSKLMQEAVRAPARLSSGTARKSVRWKPPSRTTSHQGTGLRDDENGKQPGE